jgi:hypothetical protein
MSEKNLEEPVTPDSIDDLFAENVIEELEVNNIESSVSQDDIDALFGK